MISFESKIISREISQLLWEREETVSTAESCTGGRVAEAIISIPGASKYYKGSIVSYTNETKENLLGISRALLDEKGAVCEEVVREMVKGACKTLNTNYAIAVTGYAGPTSSSDNVPVGTIWIACGTPDNQVVDKIVEDHGRDINLAIATNMSMKMFLEFLKNECDVK